MIEGRTGLYESETSDTIKWCRRFQDNLISAGGKDERYTDGVKAMQTCIKALEKQTPKKPLREKFKDVLDGEEIMCKCKSCGNEVGLLIYKGNDKTALFTEAFCSDCGQAIDWSEND